MTSKTDQEGTFTIVVKSETGLQFMLKRSNHNPNNLSRMNDTNGEAKSDGECSRIENSDDDISSSEIPICPECSRIFPSMKSLCGHLRSHPNKGYRGTIRPRIISFKSAYAQLKQKATIAMRSTPVTSHWGTTARRERTELELVYEAAEILMSMSMSMSTSTKIRVLEPAKTYGCSTCNKAFATHQALGGHRTSHNKIRNISVAETLVEHKCKTCNETFATGQALGGHMRRHFTGFPSMVRENHATVLDGFPSMVRENHATVLDLNKAPQLEEEGER